MEEQDLRTQYWIVKARYDGMMEMRRWEFLTIFLLGSLTGGIAVWIWTSVV